MVIERMTAIGLQKSHCNLAGFYIRMTGPWAHCEQQGQLCALRADLLAQSSDPALLPGVSLRTDSVRVPLKVREDLKEKRGCGVKDATGQADFTATLSVWALGTRGSSSHRALCSLPHGTRVRGSCCL